jgi:hypothetical protein
MESRPEPDKERGDLMSQTVGEFKVYMKSRHSLPLFSYCISDGTGKMEVLQKKPERKVITIRSILCRY